MYGTIGVGQKTSDYDQLRKVGDFTSDHRISNFKRCFPYNDKDQQLQSLALYLTIPTDKLDLKKGEKIDPAEFRALKKPISLRKVGFEYGNCKTEKITGNIKWYEIQYTQI